MSKDIPVSDVWGKESVITNQSLKSPEIWYSVGLYVTV